METTDAYLTVDWEKDAEYTDNCGEYPICNVRVRPSISRSSIFTRDVPVAVHYTAIDPYGNTNEECSFIVSVVCKFIVSGVCKFIVSCVCKFIVSRVCKFIVSVVCKLIVLGVCKFIASVSLSFVLIFSYFCNYFLDIFFNLKSIK